MIVSYINNDLMPNRPKVTTVVKILMTLIATASHIRVSWTRSTILTHLLMKCVLYKYTKLDENSVRIYLEGKLSRTAHASSCCRCRRGTCRICRRTDVASVTALRYVTQRWIWFSTNQSNGH